MKTNERLGVSSIWRLRRGLEKKGDNIWDSQKKEINGKGCALGEWFNNTIELQRFVPERDTELKSQGKKILDYFEILRLGNEENFKYYALQDANTSWTKEHISS